MKNIDETIAELEALDKARTQGDWAVFPAYSTYRIAKEYEHKHLIADTNPQEVDGICGLREIDAKFIAAAPTMMEVIRELWEIAKPHHAEDWDDAEDEYSKDIYDAHPVFTDDHATYIKASEMIGNRHSKGSLIDLVNWLLTKEAKLKAKCDEREWQDISTAPKDGTPIDIWSEYRGRCTNMKWEQITKQDGFFSPVKNGLSCVRDATHWMPLPAPPLNKAMEE